MLAGPTEAEECTPCSLKPGQSRRSLLSPEELQTMMEEVKTLDKAALEVGSQGLKKARPGLAPFEPKSCWNCCKEQLIQACVPYSGLPTSVCTGSRMWGKHIYTGSADLVGPGGTGYMSLFKMGGQSIYRVVRYIGCRVHLDCSQGVCVHLLWKGSV